MRNFYFILSSPVTILIRKQIHTKIRIQLFVGLITIVIWNLCCVAKISQFCFRLNLQPTMSTFLSFRLFFLFICTYTSMLHIQLRETTFLWPTIYIYICIHARAKNWTEQRETLIVLSVLFLVQSFSFRLVNEGRTRQFQFFFTYTWKCCTRFNGEATT